MARALLNGIVLAEAASDEVEVVEDSVYFPRGRVSMDLLRETATRTRCPWKGVATYYTITLPGLVLEDAAWSYRKPGRRALRLSDRVAFWKDVVVER